MNEQFSKWIKKTKTNKQTNFFSTSVLEKYWPFPHCSSRYNWYTQICSRQVHREQYHSIISGCLEKILKNCQYIFALSLLSPLVKGCMWPFICTNLNLHPRKLCTTLIWLNLTLWFLRRRKCVKDYDDVLTTTTTTTTTTDNVQIDNAIQSEKLTWASGSG